MACCYVDYLSNLLSCSITWMDDPMDAPAALAKIELLVPGVAEPWLTNGVLLVNDRRVDEL